MIKNFKDKRGYFFESFNDKIKKKLSKTFVQDNISFSKRKFTFRGFHYQIRPYSQGKLLTVLKGKIYDYVIDIDPKSKTYLKLKKFTLSQKINNQIYIPPNYAHGFITLTNNTLVTYKVTKKYKRTHERGINVFDKSIKINLPVTKSKLIISKKDLSFKYLD